jgi:hypothetical protein
MPRNFTQSIILIINPLSKWCLMQINLKLMPRHKLNPIQGEIPLQLASVTLRISHLIKISLKKYGCTPTVSSRPTIAFVAGP